MKRIWLLSAVFSTSLLSSEESFFSSEKFHQSHLGIYIIDSQTEEEIVTKNENQFFMPGSLQKIPLSAAATWLLGDDYCFKTELSYRGAMSNNQLLGDLYIKGGGDPTFTEEIFTQWKHLLQQQGIESIEGKLYVDTSSFETASASPYWEFEDLGNYFGAGCSAMTIGNNMYRITLEPGAQVGDPARVLSIDPPIPGLLYNNEVTTGPAGSGDQMYVFGSEYNSFHIFRGTIPLDLPTIVVKAAMPDPALYAAHVAQLTFSPHQGVEVIRKKEDQASSKTLATHNSRPLKDLLKTMNATSINLYAEHILKVIGNGKGALGALRVEQLLSSWGIPSHVKDGSGLARRNCLSPKGFVTLLQFIQHHEKEQSVYDSISESLNDAIIKTFPSLSNVIFKTKTGSMSQVYNLAGYFILPNGKQYTFAFFCNHHLGNRREVLTEYFRYLSDLIPKLVEKTSQLKGELKRSL